MDEIDRILKGDATKLAKKYKRMAILCLFFSIVFTIIAIHTLFIFYVDGSLDEPMLIWPFVLSGSLYVEFRENWFKLKLINKIRN
jgi:hypothetical protein